MVIKLLPEQISMFWEVIKFASVNADNVEEKDRGVYFINLLHSLLNNKSQCFVKFDDEKNLLALLITKLVIDKFTGEKTLLLQSLFSWKKSDNNEWREGFNFIKQFAEQEKCKYVATEARNPRVWEILEHIGFKEIHRKYSLTLEVV